MDAAAAGTVTEWLLSSDPDPAGLSAALDQLFDPEVWSAQSESSPYGGIATYTNLFNSEMGKSFRGWLGTQEVGPAEYGSILGSVQFNVVRSTLKAVFPQAKGNAGWRVSLLGFPSLQTAVVGMSHHYSDSPSQNKHGETSALLRQSALDQLDSPMIEIASNYRSATSDDWDGRGLFTAPITQIGTLDISGFEDGAGAQLRFVRNTTAKKDLSTFFLLRSFDRATLRESAAAQFEELARIGLALGSE